MGKGRHRRCVVTGLVCIAGAEGTICDGKILKMIILNKKYK
jgi:hypothetical protein